MRCGPCCIDVIHQQNRAPDRPGRESPGHIPAPLDEGEPPLAATPADAGQERLARQLPGSGERPGELLCRVIAPLKTAFAVGGHEGDEIGVGARQPLRDNTRRLGGEPAEASLFPAADDSADVGVVGHRRPRRGKREPPARAFAAARDRPRRRCATPRTQWRRQRRQPCAAPRTQKRSRYVTDEAAPREQQV
jgi:hypothetical protein